MKELHLKEFLKLLVKTLRLENNLKEINLKIKPAEVQLLSKMRNKAKSIKFSTNKTGKNDKSISVRARKFSNAIQMLEPNYAQHIKEIEKFRIKCFFVQR